ncbi:MAG: PD-(D/E)XK nuclease family protein [Bacteroidales bacterium]|nr:PD-(D/E)XK nuclease family protein [Bacteroidales bacterium]
MGKRKRQKNQKLDNDLNKFYSHASNEIRKVEQERRRLGRRNSPWFNPIDFWWIDERKVMQILAFLLNPSESHEQGDRYLSHFIKKFGLDFFTYQRRDKIEVKSSFLTNERKRIDLVIYKNSFEMAIAIVNRAAMNRNRLQRELEHYTDYLWNRTGDDYCLIHLSPADRRRVSPDRLSVEEQKELERSKKLKYLTYEEHLIDCVAEFGEITESVRVRSFLKDFEKTMRSKYMGEKDLEVREAMVEMINKSQRNLDLSFMVSNSLPEVKRKLKERFNSQMNSLGRELKLDAKHESDRVWLKPKSWKYHYISYSYEDGNIFFGMTQDKREENKNKFNGVLSHLNENLEGGFQYSEWWPAYKYLYKDIDSNPDFWKAIRNGKAKQEIKRFIKVLIKEFKTDVFYE